MGCDENFFWEMCAAFFRCSMEEDMAKEDGGGHGGGQGGGREGGRIG